ncbi:ABC transporter [Cryptococcus deuterogattii MMRL2647]|nr:ABC transporter [Cryptococcus deuterogattii MMRL2647]
MREVIRDHNTPHHNDGDTSSPLDTPITISEKPTQPSSILDSEWNLFSQLLADQELLKSRGLAPYKSLSLAWDHLSVRGVGALDNIEYGSSMALILAPWLRRKYRKKTALLATARSELPGAEMGDDDVMAWRPGMPTPKKDEPGLRKGERYLLKNFSGVVKSGEMMLVLGRPGSGCSTFLKVLAGHRDGYAGVEGDVNYGSLQPGKDFRPYKSEVIFISEEDLHDPNLLVGHTMDFALRMCTPSRDSRLTENPAGNGMGRKEYQDRTKLELLEMLGLTHTHDTKVGDQYIRGISGGEKKRVSIAEVLATKASVQIWDNATRGLDADTALRYVKILRALADIQRNTMVVSLYQAGNGIYDLFDKVTVIAEGRVIYYGPRAEARSYFEDLGFVHPEGGNTADFLTAVTATNERKTREGLVGRIPTTPAEFSALYERSDIAQRMREELEAHLTDPALDEQTKEFRESVQNQKDRWASKCRPEKVDFRTQVLAALIRDYQQRWGDKWTFWMGAATLLIQALIAGSVFYDMPVSTSGLFLRGGTLFLSLFFPSMISLSETTAVFTGRSVLSKHKGFSLYRPSALLLAQTIGDMPLYFVMIVMFTLIIYFMTGLQVDPGLYFIYLLFIYFTTLCTIALFRSIGYAFNTFNNASKASGFALLMLSMARQSEWINPFYYSLEALTANEIYGLELACVPPLLASYGGDYAQHNQGCAITGAEPNSVTLDGPLWVETVLDFHKSHVWRNFGILIAFWIFFLSFCALMIEMVPAAGSTKSVLLHKPGGGGKHIRKASPRDEEDGPDASQLNEKSQGASDAAAAEVHAVNSVLTWRNVCYTINANGQPRQLLNNVFGYCKAGTLTALMGSSGAGKTTLMDVLAARKTDGDIRGEILMNGKQLPISFQRTIGYCEQVDVHLPQATVREALEFSALLRQPRTLSNEEKLAYVNVIIDLLELHDIEDALIGTSEAGLGVEQRKRLTIGVELVSKPTLLFLDEPTSGLDGQSSYMIVSFLRKLAAAGQAVLCTIHQPSAALFARFDQLLLLKSGGNTVYFGAVSELTNYFEKQGVTIPKDVNPAEGMIDIVSGSLSNERDWAQVWVESDECKERLRELEELNEAGMNVTTLEDDEYEFASTNMTQLKLVTKRASIQLWRDTEYVMNKVALHVMSALFNGFSFWKIGDAYEDIQNRMFTIFLFVFVAPGVIAQTQPKFLHNRDIFEAREKKAKLYSWYAFCFAEIVAEIPYLLVCALLYFVLWYPAIGFSFKSEIAGAIYLQMTLYEFLYTGIGQFVAAYAPHEIFAALVNPLLIGVLDMFCGVLVPYDQMTAFWRYWMYYLDPFQYLIGGLISRALWDVEVKCESDEYAIFNPPEGMTCQSYMSAFLSEAPGYLNNPNATRNCEYCVISKGSDYLKALNLEKMDGWRDIALTFLFVLTSYGMVFLLLKLRSKRSKKAQ